MGADLHCVLQKRNKDNHWETILYNAFPGRCYALFDYLSGVRGPSTGIAHTGLPDDFEVTIKEETLSGLGKVEFTYHNDFWMGEHSFGHCTLEEFCESPLPYEKRKLSDKYSVEKCDDQLVIQFYDLDYDEIDSLIFIRQGLSYLFGDAFAYTNSDGEEIRTGTSEYRLVFGYDS